MVKANFRDVLLDAEGGTYSSNAGINLIVKEGKGRDEKCMATGAKLPKVSEGRSMRHGFIHFNRIKKKRAAAS